MINFTLTQYGYDLGMQLSDVIGDIRYFASEGNPAPLREQFNKMYSHGGGWNPFKGFKMDDKNILTYPEDPPLYPMAQAKFRNQTICVYQYGWVAIIEEDRTFEVSRMD